MSRLAAALLLLCSLAAARAAPAAAWPFALTEDDVCPPLPAVTVQAFVQGTGECKGGVDGACGGHGKSKRVWWLGAAAVAAAAAAAASANHRLLCPALPAHLPFTSHLPPLPRPPPAAALTKGYSANLACHLNLILARHDAGNATATALLRAMYTAWRAMHQPQRWHPAAASEAKWLASLRFVASVNTLMGNKWWAGLNSYSDLSAEEFAATVLQTSAQAGVQQAAATAATKGSSRTGTGARKLLARYVPPKPDYPIAINWATAGRVSGRAGMGAWTTSRSMCPGFSSPARQCSSPQPFAHQHLSSQSPCPLPSRSKQVLPQVSFQGQCASSWAFAAAAALESRLMIGAGTNTTAVLSAQHIMVRRMWVAGVRGGRLELGNAAPVQQQAKQQAAGQRWSAAHPLCIHPLSSLTCALPPLPSPPRRTAPPRRGSTAPPHAPAAPRPTPLPLPPPPAWRLLMVRAGRGWLRAGREYGCRRLHALRRMQQHCGMDGSYLPLSCSAHPPLALSLHHPTLGRLPLPRPEWQLCRRSRPPQAVRPRLPDWPGRQAGQCADQRQPRLHRCAHLQAGPHHRPGLPAAGGVHWSGPLFPALCRRHLVLPRLQR